MSPILDWTERLPSPTAAMDTEGLASLPGFIKPPLGQTCTLELERCGGFTIPSAPLRAHILRAFAEFVFPQMPVVNMHRIVRAVDANDGTDAVPLLLFQAIMFAGVTHVDLGHLQQYGYRSHRTVRRDYFRRVESCFNALSDTASDPVTTIQSLLLMTLWYDSSDESKDSRHWMLIIMQLSRALDMHRDSGPGYPKDPATIRLWRRIAWSTCTRDRMIFLGARRPACIRAADFTLAPLTVDDFELEPLETTHESCLSPVCRLFYDGSLLHKMAKLCVEHARLAWYIDQVVSVRDTLDGTSSAVSVGPAVLALDGKLRDWCAKGLPQHVANDQESPIFHPEGNSLVVQRSMLRLTYYAILSALYRPLVFKMSVEPCTQSRASSKRLFDTAQDALNGATEEITQLACDLYRRDLWSFLPATAVTSLLPAIIVHIMNTSAADGRVKRSSLLGFQQCLRLLVQLQRTYANADDVCSFLESSINQMKGEVAPESYEVMELSNILESLKSPATACDDTISDSSMPDSWSMPWPFGEPSPFDISSDPFSMNRLTPAFANSDATEGFDSSPAFDINDFFRLDRATEEQLSLDFMTMSSPDHDVLGFTS